MESCNTVLHTKRNSIKLVQPASSLESGAGFVPFRKSDFMICTS